jgi:hypothetical protein
MNAGGPKIHTVEGEAQRRAISSPLRLEILGHFSAGGLHVVVDLNSGWINRQIAREGGLDDRAEAAAA